MYTADCYQRDIVVPCNALQLRPHLVDSETAGLVATRRRSPKHLDQEHHKHRDTSWLASTSLSTGALRSNFQSNTTVWL